MARKRPNILFVMADQMAAPALAAYGHKVTRTPRLDSLAEHAAFGVEILHSQPGAAEIAIARPGVDAGHRAGDADPDLGLGRQAPKGDSRNDGDDRKSHADH